MNDKHLTDDDLESKNSFLSFKQDFIPPVSSPQLKSSKTHSHFTNDGRCIPASSESYKTANNK